MAALPPLGSLAGLPSFGGSDDTYDDYADVNLFAEGENTTDITVSSDMTSDDMTSDDMSSEPSTGGPVTEGPDPDNEGLSGGAIAGIVIGSLAGVALIAGGVYYLKVKSLLCFK